MNANIFIINIRQKDNYTFSVHWNDGLIQDFRLSDLQKNCPCAHCADEATGKCLVDHQTIPDDLKAIAIRSVGRYGLRIQFTSGCSTGIYSFDRLRILGSVEKLTFDNAGAPDLQQAKPVSKQPMCEHMGDADSCKDGDAGAVKSEFSNRTRYTFNQGS